MGGKTWLRMKSLCGCAGEDGERVCMVYGEEVEQNVH